MDGSSNVSDVFAKQIFGAVEAIRSKKKRPDCVSVDNHITRHNATNLNKKAVQDTIEVLVDKILLKNIPTAVGDSYYIIPKDQDNTTVLERSEKESQLKEKLPTVIDCDKSAIKSSGLYGKKDKGLYKKPRPIKTDIINNYESEFSGFKGFVASELSCLKNLINDIFLKSENEQPVKEIVHLREENLSKALIIKTLS